MKGGSETTQQRRGTLTSKARSFGQSHYARAYISNFRIYRTRFADDYGSSLRRPRLERQQIRKNRDLDDESSRLSRAREEGPGRPSEAGDHGAHGRDRQDHQDDDLRHRPAHPQGRRPELPARPHSRSRRRRHRRQGRAGRHGVQAGRPGPDLLHQRLRQMRLLPQAHVLALHHRRLDPRQHASTARRPSSSAFPTRIPASIRFPTAPTKRRW